MSNHPCTQLWTQLFLSVSHSDVARVARYIANQEEHHRERTHAEEYKRVC
jgi:hypothetical protein